MNYFSHFVVDHQPGNHEYNTGLLLPDITRRWIKKFQAPAPGEQISPIHYAFLQGCLQHYQSDKQFHSSSFFDRYFRELSNRIGQADMAGSLERKWFISHVMLELLIDRVIVGYDKQLLDSFYESLDKADDAGLRSFLKANGMKNDDAFFTFFDHFRSVQYIYQYTDNNAFAYSLNRIMMRAGVKQFSETDSAALIGVMLGFEKEYFGNAAKMIAELKAVFT
jgi:hypothetical protein